MLKSFDEAEKMLLSTGVKYTVILCGAENKKSLEALIKAKKKGISDGILFGDKDKICAALIELGENPEDFSIYDACGFEDMAELSSDLFIRKRADIIMNGNLETKEFLYTINRIDAQMSTGGRFLNKCFIFEHKKHNRLVFAANSLFDDAPGITEKVAMIRNSVGLARSFGLEKPVACVVSMTDNDCEAKTLARSVWNDCEIKGPHKIDDAIEQGGDILIMPDMYSGETLYSSLDYFSRYCVGSVVCGAVPTALTCSSDSVETQYTSILAAAVQCSAKN